MRLIHLKDNIKNIDEKVLKETNKIRTTLYTFYNFLPLGLYYQII